MLEKNINEMTIDELIAEVETQHEIVSNARYRAKSCESKAVSMFLVKNNLNGIILHKPTGRKGVLHQNYDNRRFVLIVEFYPLKKNGEESMNKSWDCTVWETYQGIKQNFEKLLEAYEPVDDKR